MVNASRTCSNIRQHVNYVHYSDDLGWLIHFKKEMIQQSKLSRVIQGKSGLQNSLII